MWRFLFISIFSDFQTFSKMTDDVFKPETLIKSEKGDSMIAIENMLRERLLMRKELKIEQLEKRLSEVSFELHKAEEKLKEYESLIGLREFQKICKTFEQWIRYFNGTNSVFAEHINGTNEVIGEPLQLNSSLIGRALIEKSSVIGGFKTHQTSSSEVIQQDHGVWVAVLLALIPECINIFKG